MKMGIRILNPTKFSHLVLVLILLAGVLAYYQRQQMESSSGISLGWIDDFEANDNRIAQPQEEGTFQFQEEYEFLQNLDLKNYGVVQLSLLMK